MTSRFCSKASLAVMRDPLLSGASITTRIGQRPLMIRFLCGKHWRFGLRKGTCSLKSRPLPQSVEPSDDVLMDRCFPAHYRGSLSFSLAGQYTLGARCRQFLEPDRSRYSPPNRPTDPRGFLLACGHRGVGLRVPTIATQGWLSESKQPFEKARREGYGFPPKPLGTHPSCVGVFGSCSGHTSQRFALSVLSLLLSGSLQSACHPLPVHPRETFPRHGIPESHF